MKERISNVIAWVGLSCLILSLPATAFMTIDALQTHPKKVLYTSCAVLEAGGSPYDAMQLEQLGVNWRPASTCERSGGWVHVWSYKGEIRWNYYYTVWMDRKEFAEYYDDYTSVRFEKYFSLIKWLLPLWLISIVINYILFGSARLFPWKKAVINE